jgi:hypothetical protein
MPVTSTNLENLQIMKLDSLFFNIKSHGGEVKEELEYRKALRICRVNPLLTCFRNEIIPLHFAELIGKVGEKLEGKGTKTTGGDSHFCMGKCSKMF